MMFASGRFTRLAVSPDDVIAGLHEEKYVKVLDRDGQSVRTIPARGKGYAFDEPVDIAYDALGHLFVLDEGSASVFVFGAGSAELVRIFTLPEKSEGAFRRAKALALDPTGRLYIYDAQTGRVMLYR